MVTKNKWHDHKVAGLARNLWRSSIWIPLLRQVQLELVAQDHVLLSFECLQGWRLHNPSGQTIPMFEHLHNRHFFPFFLYSYGIPVCASCLFCFYWAVMRRVWLSLLYPSLVANTQSLLCYNWESGCNAKNIIQMRSQTRFRLDIRKKKSLF